MGLIPSPPSSAAGFSPAGIVVERDTDDGLHFSGILTGVEPSVTAKYHVHGPNMYDARQGYTCEQAGVGLHYFSGYVDPWSDRIGKVSSSVAKAATRCLRSPVAGSGLPGPGKREPLAALLPKGSCSGALVTFAKACVSIQERRSESTALHHRRQGRGHAQPHYGRLHGKPARSGGSARATTGHA